ncbi:MAG TPA: transglycosylase SLT domain-containing protein [Acidimicrobiia bacterium]
MSVLVSILLLWFGAAEPVDLAAELEEIAFEQLADPVERWRPLVEEHFPAEEVEVAICIIGHESGGNPEADNPRSSATGLFQVLSSLWGDHYGVTHDQLLDPEQNTRVARSIWGESGWRAWSAYRRCDHIPRVVAAESETIDVCTRPVTEPESHCVS